MVSLNDVTAVDTASADTAVVGPLRTREAVSGPAVWPAVESQKSVFLLQTKPDLVLFVGLHQACGIMAEIEFIRCSIRVPGLAHDQNIVAEADGVSVHSHWSNIDIGVVARRLTGGGAVEIPFGEIVNALGSLAQGLEDVRLAEMCLQVITIPMCQKSANNPRQRAVCSAGKRTVEVTLDRPEIG